MSIGMWVVLLALFSVAALVIAGILLFKARRQGAEEDVLTRLDRPARPQNQQDAQPVEILQANNPVTAFIVEQFFHAGVDANPVKVNFGIGFILIGTLFVGVFVNPVTAALFLICILGLVYALLLNQANRRQKKIVLQLPDFLDHVLRAMVAGNTLEESFISAARESPEPSRSLFLSVSRQVRLGASLEEVLAEVGKNQNLRDLQVLALSARVNRRYGGSMRRVVKSMILSIRQRDAAARELRALTAETRVSAIVLAVIPISLMAYILFQNPEFYNDMWQDKLGKSVLIMGGVLQVLGIIIIWRMMRSTLGEQY